LHFGIGETPVTLILYLPHLRQTQELDSGPCRAFQP